MNASPNVIIFPRRFNGHSTTFTRKVALPYACRVVGIHIASDTATTGGGATSKWVITATLDGAQLASSGYDTSVAELPADEMISLAVDQNYDATEANEVSIVFTATAGGGAPTDLTTANLDVYVEISR